MKYDKLVRDLIPEIIKDKGKSPIFYIADDSEYWQKLREKLQEEVQEFLQDENVEELADVLEVIYAICDHKNILMQDVEDVRKKKAIQRGGFSKKIILDKVE